MRGRAWGRAQFPRTQRRPGERARALARPSPSISDLAYRPRASARALALGRDGHAGARDPVLHPSVRDRAGARRAGRPWTATLQARPVQRRQPDAARRVPRPARAAGSDGRAADRLAGLRATRRWTRCREGRARGAGRCAAPPAAARRHRRRLTGGALGDAASARAGSRTHRVRRRHERPPLRFDLQPPAAEGLSRGRSSRRRGTWSRSRAGSGSAPTGGSVAPPAPTTELLSLPEPPTAIFAASDIPGARRARGRGLRGHRRPRTSCRWIGFDDLEVAPYLGLTTVAPAAVRERPSRPGAAAVRDGRRPLTARSRSGSSCSSRCGGRPHRRADTVRAPKRLAAVRRRDGCFAGRDGRACAGQHGRNAASARPAVGARRSAWPRRSCAATRASASAGASPRSSCASRRRRRSASSPPATPIRREAVVICWNRDDGAGLQGGRRARRGPRRRRGSTSPTASRT